MPTCQVCKTSLPGFQSRGRKRYYCSKNCKQRAYRTRKKKVLPRKRSKRPESKLPTCFVCERPLLLPRTGQKPKYCSANCKQKDYRKRRFVMREKYQKALRNNLLRLNHKSVEWHTPMEYISAVREVFGGHIKLDPASSEKANETVQAFRFFDRATNGLAQEWKGRIYLPKFRPN